LKFVKLLASYGIKTKKNVEQTTIRSFIAKRAKKTADVEDANDQWRHMGFVCVLKTSPNGSCMFEAIAHQLSLSNSDNKQSPASVRRQLVSYVHEHPSMTADIFPVCGIRT